MAEGEDKKNQQTNQNNPAKKPGDLTNEQKSQRKRRRRPRKNKNHQQKQQSTDEKTFSLNEPGPAKPAPPVNKPAPPVNKPAPPVNKPAPPVNKPAPVKPAPVPKEPEITTEVEVPVEEFLASNDEKKAPEPTAPPPELPNGPVGWDQLKNAIKEDHEKSENPVANEKIPEAIPAEISTEPAPEPAQVVEPEVVSAPEPEPIPLVSGVENLAADDDAEKQEIIKIIVKYVFGGCAVIAILAGIFLFNIPGTIYNIASDLLDDGETKQEQVKEQPDTTPDKTPDKIPKPDSDLTDGTGTALISGGQIPKVRKVPTSVQILFDIGFPEVITSDSDRITTYLFVLNELQNGFETDINQLLDASANRASALEIHLRELNGLLAEAEFTYENLNEEADDIKVDFNKVSTQKDTLEEAFFVALDKLAASESNQILNDFVDVSMKQINLKAEFNALTKISEMFDVAIRNMKARIKDIEANKQALVKGVKIVDIKGSDLDLIIQEGEL